MVLECTGFYRQSKSKAHLTARRKTCSNFCTCNRRFKTIVFNVNHDALDGRKQLSVAQVAQQTVWHQWQKCLMILWNCKRFNDNCAYLYKRSEHTRCTASKGDLRRARAAAQNIVPNSTGAAKQLVLCFQIGKRQARWQRTTCSHSTGSWLNTGAYCNSWKKNNRRRSKRSHESRS